MKAILVLCVLAFIVCIPEAHALYGHVFQERKRREYAEQQLAQAQQNSEQIVHHNEHLHIVISILSAGVVTALIAGATIGSKTRNNHES